MRHKGLALKLPIGRIHPHLIRRLALFVPILIRGSFAQYFDSIEVKERCSLCTDGGQVRYPDATIPYLSLPGTDSTSCSDLDFVSSLVPIDGELCAKYRANAGYCGCPEAEPINTCTFCPEGDFPSHSEFILPTGDTCNDLYTYVSFFEEEQCTSFQYERIVKNAYDCGCKLSMSEVLDEFVTRKKVDDCTLCPDGSSVPKENYFLDLAGMTCGDYASFINGLNPHECEIQTSRGTFDLFAYQCNCPGTAPPVCPKQERPELCTVSLLNSVDIDEPCECYSFCDGEFVGCDSWPGNFLRDKCPRNGVSGCNYASAIDDINGSDTDVDDPNCTLCPGGIEPSYKNKIATGDITCKDFAGTVLTWESGTCDLEESYLSIIGARCGCITAEFPICPVQKNPWLCTINLLRSTDEDCECYNFCGDQFHSCADYPGKSLDASQCPEGITPIAGCNQALATSQRCNRPSIGPGCDESNERQQTYMRHLRH
jgi:hypothetical protein